MYPPSVENVKNGVYCHGFSSDRRSGPRSDLRTLLSHGARKRAPSSLLGNFSGEFLTSLV